MVDPHSRHHTPKVSHRSIARHLQPSAPRARYSPHQEPHWASSGSRWWPCLVQRPGPHWQGRRPDRFSGLEANFALLQCICSIFQCPRRKSNHQHNLIIWMNELRIHLFYILQSYHKIWIPLRMNPISQWYSSWWEIWGRIIVTINVCWNQWI